MVGDKWFIKKEDGVFGPVSAADLQNLIKNGRITLDQEASQNETGPWEPLKSYDLFKERPRPIEEMFEDEDESSPDDNLEAGTLVNETTNHLIIEGNQIKLADGSNVDRTYLSSSTVSEDYNTPSYRSNLGFIGMGSLVFGLLIIVAAATEGTEDFLFGRMSIPLGVLSVLLGGYCFFKIVRLRQLFQHIVISVEVNSNEMELLRTNDKTWAKKVTDKLTKIVDIDKGDWEFDAIEKSISQLR